MTDAADGWASPDWATAAREYGAQRPAGGAGGDLHPDAPRRAAKSLDSEGRQLPPQVQRELWGYIRDISAAPASQRLDALGLAAQHVAAMVASGRVAKHDAVDRLHDTAAAIGIGDDDIQARLSEAFAAPPLADSDYLVEPIQVPSARGNGRAPRVSWRDQVTTAAELQRMRFAELTYVVPGVLAEGLTILAGRPKLGKSWLALDLALGVASGRGVLGGIVPAQGDVLYCALEDTRRRLQRRTDRLCSPFAAEWPQRLTLATQWRRLDAGGVADIAAWAASVTAPRLVILDTLAGVRPSRQAGEAMYDGDYRALVELHHLAGERGMAVLVIHHTRKMEADDPLDTVSGTLGLAGCADTVLVLARTSQGSTLYVRGRDIEEAERAIAWDGEGCRWSLGGDAAEAHRSAGRTVILSALRTGGEMTPQDIAAAADLDYDATRQLLVRMVAAAEVIRVGRGRYRHPSHPPSHRSHRHDGSHDTDIAGISGGCDVVTDVTAPALGRPGDRLDRGQP